MLNVGCWVLDVGSQCPRPNAANRTPSTRSSPRWQRVWAERQTFHAPNPGEPGFDPVAAEVLRARHVSVSERRGAARRPSGRLHRHGHPRALQADARLQRAASDGLGRVRAAGGAVRHQDRRASRDQDRDERRQLPSASSSASASPTTGSARSTRPTRLLQAGRSGFSSSSTTPGSIRTTQRAGTDLDLSAGDDPDSVPPRLRQRSARELVPRTRHGAGE